jgi:pimeloyl-ACP methyl ester carboxylesterase
MREILDHTATSDLKDLAEYVAQAIEKYRPTSIVCHDMGVPLTLLALLRLKKKGKLPPARLTIFNGAFRHVSLLKARQPLRLQYTPVRKIVREVQENGGSVDLDLMRHVPRIRSFFRKLILHRLADKVTSAIGMDYLGKFPRSGLGLPTQIIASPNDPYLPYEAVEQLRHDLSPEKFWEVEYGHFPYSVPAKKIRPLIENFERG